MALVVVAEDDSGTLKLISVILQKQGHGVVPALDGASAWRLILEHRPDIVVSDVNMPGMSGFELLKQVRSREDVGQTPFLLLTSLQERQAMRQGMTLGADDYLTKPLNPRELVDAVEAQLNRQSVRLAARDLHVRAALTEALQAQASELHKRYETRLARELSEQWPGDARNQGAKTYPLATVLFADIRNYPAWLAALSASEMGDLLKHFYENSGDTAHLFGANTLHFVGEGVLAVFADEEPSPTSPQCLRALKTALGLRSSAAGMATFLAKRFPGRKLPPFDVGIALHGGPVAMTRLDGILGGKAQLIPVGETVVDAMAMQRHASPTGSAITVSVPVLRSITGAVKTGPRYLLSLPNRNEPMDVCAVEALQN